MEVTFFSFVFFSIPHFKTRNIGGYAVDLLPISHTQLLKEKALVRLNFFVGHFKEILRSSTGIGPLREQSEV